MLRFVSRPCLLAPLSILWWSAAALADPVRVAVVPGVAVNLDSARVDALSQDLADALGAKLEVVAAGGLEVRRRLPADGLPPDCLTTPACVADVSARLGASQLLFVVMVDATGTGAVQIDSTWVDATTGKSAARPAIDVPAIAEAKARFAAAAHSLLPDAPVRPEPTTGGDRTAPGFGGVMSAEVPRHLTRTTYITGGVALAGLGFGIGFGLAARSKYHTCESPLAGCRDDERDAIRTRTLIADAGFVIAIGGAIATGILYATSGKESRLVIAPQPAAGGGATLSASGRF